MTDHEIISLGTTVMFLALKLAAPVLIISLVTGLSISVFQAVTQIQEMTLTFVPKIVVAIVAMIIFGPWMLTTLTDFTTTLITNIPNYVR